MNPEKLITLKLKEAVEALIDFEGVTVADGKNDGLGRHRTHGILDGVLHKLADDRIIGPGV